jgi:hypothetical protein
MSSSESSRRSTRVAAIYARVSSERQRQAEGRTLRQTSHGRTDTKEKTTSTSGPRILPNFTDPRTAEGPHN